MPHLARPPQDDRLTPRCLLQATPADKFSLLKVLGILRALASGVSVWYAPCGRRRAASGVLATAIEKIVKRWTSASSHGRKAAEELVNPAAKEATLGMQARRTMTIPLCAGERHSFRTAMYDFCKRPPLGDGSTAFAKVARDTEVAAHRTSRHLKESD